MPAGFIPRRLDGIVTEEKGLVRIEYKPPGMVKTKVESFPADTTLAYMVGEPGFVVVSSGEPITAFVGKLSIKNDQMTVTNDAGTIVLNRQPWANVQLTEVEEGSREARAAERAGKVKVKLPRSARAGKTKTKEKAGKTKSKDTARTVVKKKKKRAA